MPRDHGPRAEPRELDVAELIAGGGPPFSGDAGQERRKAGKPVLFWRAGIEGSQGEPSGELYADLLDVAAHGSTGGDC